MLREPEEVVAKGAELVQGVAEGASDSDIEIKLYYIISFFTIIYYIILYYSIIYHSKIYYSII